MFVAEMENCTSYFYFMSFNSRKQLTALYIDATYSKNPSNIWEIVP